VEQSNTNHDRKRDCVPTLPCYPLVGCPRATGIKSSDLKSNRHLVCASECTHEDRNHHQHVATQTLQERSTIDVEPATALRLHHGKRRLKKERDQTER